MDKPIPVKGGIVGINSFGFGGSNVHVILRPAKKADDVTSPARVGPRLLQACGRTEAAVNAVIQRGKEHAGDDSFLSLLNEVSGAPAGSMPYRGYALVGSQSDVTEVQQVQASARPLWYICSGTSEQKDEGRGARGTARPSMFDRFCSNRHGHTVGWHGPQSYAAA